jgi:peptidoglycan L-alanyl-D-glutamate endopeptidase CwlK
MTFNARSLKCLAECHPDLQNVLGKAAETYKFQIICGYRSLEDQQKAFDAGNSKARPGQSPHNYSPSYAFDVVPVPLDWEDKKAFDALAKAILAASKEEGIPLTWGGNFKGFYDGPHFQLSDWKERAGL